MSAFVVSGSSSDGSVAWVRAQWPARLDVREDAFQVADLVAQPRVARLRLRANAIESLLDVVAVGDDELELDRLEVVVGISLGPEAPQHCDQGVGLTELAENRRAQAWRHRRP